jgi:hypothetical protein
MFGIWSEDESELLLLQTKLSAAVIQEWQEIDQAVIQDLFEGMPRRMEAVIQARGGNIR